MHGVFYIVEQEEVLDMSVILVEVTRAGRVECVHRGDVVVTRGGGEIMSSAGDASRMTYMRSSAKPLIALCTVQSGAVERYGLSDAELAVTCASHYAEDFHRAAVMSILDKAGVPREKLMSPPGPSLSPSYALKQAASGHVLDAFDSNCSGKHAGMLATCAAKGWPLDGYMSPDHPLQRWIVEVLEEMCVVPHGSIEVGEDGCGVPVHWMPLGGMARGYARLSTPNALRADLRDACRAITRAMIAHPEMIAGTGGFCSELIRGGRGRLIAKLGAEGVYCIGVMDQDIGVAIKVDDGASRALPVTAMHVLASLGLWDSGTPDELSRHVAPEVKNDHGHIVGGMRAVFEI